MPNGNPRQILAIHPWRKNNYAPRVGQPMLEVDKGVSPQLLICRARLHFAEVDGLDR